MTIPTYRLTILNLHILIYNLHRSVLNNDVFIALYSVNIECRAFYAFIVNVKG